MIVMMKLQTVGDVYFRLIWCWLTWVVLENWALNHIVVYYYDFFTSVNFSSAVFSKLPCDALHCITFSKIDDISLTAVKIPDISRFSRQVVTLCLSVCLSVSI